jgi:hypothetical protein
VLAREHAIPSAGSEESDVPSLLVASGLRQVNHQRQQIACCIVMFAMQVVPKWGLARLAQSPGRSEHQLFTNAVDEEILLVGCMFIMFAR